MTPDEIMTKKTNKSCKHCKIYFKVKKRKCTAILYGECDCPRCQGLCNHHDENHVVY